MTTQGQIARECGVDISTVNKILRKVPGPSFSKNTIRRVFAAARALGYDLGRLKFGHKRKAPRKAVEIQVALTICEDSGRGATTGKGILRDVSLDGAVLRGIILIRQSLPTVSHTIRIRPTDPAHGAIELEGRAIRFVEDGETLGLAVEFTKTRRDLLAWIRRIS